jgi:MFS family permease
METAEPRTSRLPVVALLVAITISTLGTQFTVIAVPWFVLQTTGSAARTGITGFVSLLPVIIAGFLGGALVDRVGFKRSSVLSDVASGLMVAAIPLLHYTVGLAFWQLLVLVFLRELCTAPGRNARGSLLPDLIALSGFGRERINAANQFIFSTVGMIGAPLAGLMIALFGPSNVLWIDAASFIISAAIVAALVPRRAIAAAAKPDPKGYVGELAAGLRFLRGNQLIAVLIGIGATLNVLGSACFGILLPVHVSRSGWQASDLGLLLAGVSGGTLLGTLCYGLIAPRLPRRTAFVAAFFLSAPAFWVLSLTPPLWAMIAALIAMGVALAPINPIFGTIMQERIPADLRGRVFGLSAALMSLAAPLSFLVAGLAIEYVATSAAFAAIAGLFLLLTFVIARLPALRDLAPPPTVAAVGEQTAEKPDVPGLVTANQQQESRAADDESVRGPEALVGGASRQG